MKNKKPTKKQIEAAMSAYCSSMVSVEEHVPREIKMRVAMVKEMFNIEVWELFIKQSAYWAELNGHDVEEYFENWDWMDMLEEFAEWQVGYWIGVREGLAEQDDQDDE